MRAMQATSGISQEQSFSVFKEITFCVKGSEVSAKQEILRLSV